jgi:F-type H+-transporting ATPase subunit a
MSSPLDQFVVKPIIPLSIAGFDVSFTNASLFMMATVLAAYILMVFMTRPRAMIPSRTQALAELVYEFIYTLARDIIGYKATKYLPFILSLFLIVLLGNLLGMVPYGFTITSHIVVTGALGAMVILAVTGIGIYNHGLHFFSLFAPKGLPLPIYLILIPVEVISFLSRPITLAVRLGANMMAGHTMLKVFALFSVEMGILLGLGPMLFNVALVAFELLVAVLQAYIFAILTCIYLRDAVDLHH